MDVRLTWTDCDEAGDYVVPNVFSSMDLVSRPDNMDETLTPFPEIEAFLIVQSFYLCLFGIPARSIRSNTQK